MIDRTALIEAVGRRYRAAGPYAVHFARGKLRHDPVYFDLLELGVIDPGLDVLDLGCGQGILLALLAALAEGRGRLRGIDIDSTAARRARAALGTRADVVQADIAATQFPRSDVIVLLDTLHYLAPAAQKSVLERASRALAGKGRLLLRVCDPQRTLRARFTVFADRMAGVLRGEHWGRYHLRSIEEWSSLLQSRGLQVSSQPMSRGTPFANVLLIARKA